MNYKQIFALFIGAYFTILSNITGQQSFQRGYFITNEGTRVECAINNLEWRNNPEIFTYKLERSLETKTATIENVKEFGIGDQHLFVRRTVNVDQSSTSYISVSKQRNPEYKLETAFLRSIVRGKANLYQYRREGLMLFFYNKGEQPVEPLVYKIYRSVNSGSVMKENERYKQQLSVRLRCLKPEIEGFAGLKYTKRDLEKIFIRYNDCAEYPSNEETYDSELTAVQTSEEPSLSAVELEQVRQENLKKIKPLGPLSLSVKPRLSFSRLFLGRNTVPNVFKGDLSVRPGLELSYNSITNDRRLSAFGEVVWQRLNLGGFSTVNGERQKIDYLEFPIGLRYQFSTPRSGSSFFVDAAVLGVVSLTNTPSTGPNSVTKPGASLAFGLGYRGAGRLSFELRQTLSRNIEVTTIGTERLKYQLISFIAGYRIL